MGGFDFSDAVRRTIAEQHDEIAALGAENARLREALTALMVGTNRVLCEGKDAWQCAECPMSRDREHCAMTDAMDAAGVDQRGEPCGFE